MYVRRCRIRIPEELRVVVRMRIDEAGTQDEPVGVDRAAGGFIDITHGDDASISHPEIADEAGLTRAVDDRGSLDQMVEHRTPPELSSPTLRIAPQGASAVAAAGVEYPAMGTKGVPMDRYIIVSADGHAGLKCEDYRPYLAAKYHPQFDEFLAEREARRA